MNSVAETAMRPDLISADALEITSDLLLERNPDLARVVKKQLENTPTHAHEETPVIMQLLTRRSSNPHQRYPINLSAEHVGQIVALLTELGEAALQQQTGNIARMAVIKLLMDEWTNFGEWLIMQIDSPSAAIH